MDQLGLDQTHLQLDDRGVPVFDPQTLQCSVEHIFIAGDANNHLPLLHEAADEGGIAGRNAALLPNVQPGDRTVPLAVVFSDPQNATIGMRPANIHEQFSGRFAEAVYDFADQAPRQGTGQRQRLNEGMG